MSSPLAGRRVLLGVTGGIAAYKAAYLARLLRDRGAEVQVVLTPAATRFVGPDTFAPLTGREVYSDVFEHPEAVLHVRLAREADAAVVAPATANILAKLALGIADDLLTSALLEFRGPMVVAPAMHSGMHDHPATQDNLRKLRERLVVVVGPVEGPLAAGDEGMGRMAEPEDVVASLEQALGGEGGERAQAGDLAGRHVLVTAGPTLEPIDAVRYVGNRSSGKMGFAIAEEAARRGARVTLVTGPSHLPDPRGIHVDRVETAEQMRAMVASRAGDADAVIMAAAVADFRPQKPTESKLKKEEGVPEIHLEPTPDILRELGTRKGDRVLVGFAAETDDLEAAGRKKLEGKNLDLVVVNRVGASGTGFGTDTDEAMILARDGQNEPLRTWTKRDLAAAVLDRVGKLLSK
ncbi:MAG TPA: bifunctional phosphopantothenoylcysteine decarboxylase/phosphopantothenate--cysteine ligase CoaBC [Actinomycetota bacterium]|nr:bifunctional phosphopantothenoylcysteine decarboxylase/phosphopantothenate--cysteine ligase CoaBC [Actinomycetota bacterium]